jgi:predicted O-methyltransferase YrrM
MVEKQTACPGTPAAPQILVPEFEIVREGIPYLDVLRRIHEELAPGKYLEIGVRHGHSLVLAQCTGIGIDPAPQITLELGPQHKLFELTSDAFFERHAAATLAQDFDLAFIDGMHWFEFALRDFINIERYAQATSLVVFDDIFPNHPRQAERQRHTRVWMGDIWKIVPCLQQYRPDLLLLRVDASQAGLLMVAGLDPENRELERQYPAIIRQFVDDEPQVTPEVLSRAGAIAPEDSRLGNLIALLREQRTSGASPSECYQALRDF